VVMTSSNSVGALRLSFVPPSLSSPASSPDSRSSSSPLSTPTDSDHGERGGAGRRGGKQNDVEEKTEQPQ
jgi:hypothetical protein